MLAAVFVIAAAAAASAAPAPGGTPTRTPSATLTSVQALWVENSLPGTITEFKGATLTTPGAFEPNPALTNHSANLFPDTAGVAFDTSNNQWATVCGNDHGNHGSITKFTAAKVAALKTNSAPAASVILSDNGTGKLVNCPWQIALDKSGDLWAANSNEFEVTVASGFVTEYQPSQFATGHPTPHITLTSSDFRSPTGVAFDSSGNFFVTDFGEGQFNKPGAGAVLVFKAATVARFKAGTNNLRADAVLYDRTSATPADGAFDANGNFWVADCEAAPSGEIYMFSKAVLTLGTTKAAAILRSTSVTTPTGIEKSLDCPGGIAFDAKGNLWYTNFSPDFVDNVGTVGEFTKSQLAATGITMPKPTIFLVSNASRTNFSQPIGLTFGPSE
jgi:hypothetical protein